MRTLVIGGGIAGQAVLEAVRERDPDHELTLVCAEPRLPYDRVALSKALTESDVDLTLGSASMWDHAALTLKTGERVTSIDAAGKTVEQLKTEKVLAPWEEWGKGFIKTDRYVELLYRDLSRR